MGFFKLLLCDKCQTEQSIAVQTNVVKAFSVSVFFLFKIYFKLSESSFLSMTKGNILRYLLGHFFL